MENTPFLFIRLPNGTSHGRSWNGDDEKAGRTWHGFIPEEEDPTHITLHWQTSKSAPLHYIGTYRLNLTELAKAGYIRRNSRPASNGRTNGFEVQFVHSGNDCIYIQKSKAPRAPRLVVGEYV